uniref:hypothetical protein n=1 Tax=Salmonella enterica TaxID=28901 RepID=UPI00329A3FA7
AKLAGELVRGLHRAFQDTQPVAAILAGLPGAKARVTEVVSYTERFDLRRLEPLEATAAIEAIRRPLTDHGIQLA